jgi:hypothetical protein
MYSKAAYETNLFLNLFSKWWLINSLICKENNLKIKIYKFNNNNWSPNSPYKFTYLHWNK